VSTAQREHQVTPLELFFDLVFVFAITQVTSMMSRHPTWTGVLHGMLVLAAVWWAWTTYAWLTSGNDVDEGGVRLAMLAAMGAMLGVALAVPGAFGSDAVFFGVAYLLVRVLHVILSWLMARAEPDRLVFLYRSTGRIWRRRSYGAIVLLALVPAALAIPALAALGLVSTVCAFVVAHEAIGRREHRVQIRKAECGLA
jgi:low temperature requirement protein LtrA